MVLAPNAGGQQSVEAPKGYAWRALPEDKAAILVPNGWTVSVATEEGSRRYSETEPGTRTPATFMFQVLRGPSKVDPEEFANDLIAGISSVYQVEKTWSDSRGPFIIRSAFFRETGDPAARNKAYTQVIVNKVTGTKYIIGFETLERDWEGKWEIGKVVAGMFQIDDEI